MINFVIIGAGWRSEFYLRIAKMLPELFNVSAICVRNKERAIVISQQYSVNVVDNLNDLFALDFDFIVNCINKEDISDFAVELSNKGYYVLCETPIISKPLEEINYDKIQVAEQFHLKGYFQAIKKILNMGIIGDITHINMSMAHDYHGMSLIRFLLGEYDKPIKLGEYFTETQILKTNGRIGEFKEKYYDNSLQKIKIYEFGNKTVIHDFTNDQYFSPVRKDRILIRGTRGEIDNKSVRYYNKNNEFIENDIVLHSAGLLDGFYNDRITFENKVLFEYPYKQARLSEEETAIVQCLIKMKRFIETGEELYSYNKAYEDYSFFEM